MDERKAQLVDASMSSPEDTGCEFLRDGLDELEEFEQQCSVFLDRMRHGTSYDLVQRAKSFVNNFVGRQATEASAEECSHSVKSFVEEMSVALREHPLWKEEGEESIHHATEAMERYLMHHLYKVAFSLPSTTDADDDRRLYHRIRTLQFLRPHHLDIPDRPLNKVAFELAAGELCRLDCEEGKAPKEKLSCILNSISILSNLLKHYEQDEGTGADSLLSHVIYTILLLSPTHMHSNLRYIRRFRRESEFRSEIAYYFTQMESALLFITKASHESLSISKEEFERGVRLAEEKVQRGEDVPSIVPHTLRPRRKQHSTRKLKTAAERQPATAAINGWSQLQIPLPVGVGDTVALELSGSERLIDFSSPMGRHQIAPTGWERGGIAPGEEKVEIQCHIVEKFLTSRFEELTVGELQQLYTGYKSLAAWCRKREL